MHFYWKEIFFLKTQEKPNQQNAVDCIHNAPVVQVFYSVNNAKFPDKKYISHSLIECKTL